MNLVLSTLLLATPAAARPARPVNVLLVVLDAARADRLSSYGYARPTTPRLDRLARGGALFESHFAAATDTYNSVPRLLSSRPLSLPLFQADPALGGALPATPDSLRWDFDDAHVLLPRALAAAGWDTALVSGHSAMYAASPLARAFGEVLLHSPLEPSEGLADKAVEWLRRRGRDKPFFLYVHAMAPHGPYPEDATDPALLPPPSPELAAVRARMRRPLDLSARGWTPDDLARLSALYDAKLRRADAWVGRILDELERRGLAKDTLVVVTADHGELFGEHGRILHGGPAYEELLRVPLLLSHPSLVPRGRRVAALTSALDVVPTVLDFCGVTVPGAAYAGRSLRGVLAGDPGPSEVFSEDYLRTQTHAYIASLDEASGSGAGPEMKAALRAAHASRVAPYRELMTSRPRLVPPAHPFTLALIYCSFAPASVLSRTPVIERRADLPEGRAARPWALSEQGHLPGLVRHPAAPDRPVTVTCDLPPGRYRAALLAETLGGREVPTPARVRYRYGGRGAFLSVGPDGDLGLVSVSGEGFRVELAMTADPSLTRLSRLRFEVPDAAGRDGRAPDAAEILRAQEGLRALGYR